MADNFFLRWIGPGTGGGLSFELWLKQLAENRFRISFPYLGRTARDVDAAPMSMERGKSDSQGQSKSNGSPASTSPNDSAKISSSLTFWRESITALPKTA